MREDEKQSLIERAEQLIKHAEEARDEIPFGLGDDVEDELALIKIALASLTENQCTRCNDDGWRVDEMGMITCSCARGQAAHEKVMPRHSTPPAPEVT